MSLLEPVPGPSVVAPWPVSDATVWPITTDVNAAGQLSVGGVSLVEIAGRFGTPTYVLDEADFRHRIHCYRSAFPDARLVYAGKALLTTSVARWAAEEHMGVDVCSIGELAVALAGGMDPEEIVLHGNAKSFDDLQVAVSARVGQIVIDSLTEIDHLATLVRRPQEVLLRVIPEVDIRGHAAMTTGVADQKFGFSLAGATLVDAVRRILGHPGLRLVGLHCHIGSQVTDAGLYGEATRRMVAAMADIRDEHGLVLPDLNIGGGHGVRYVESDGELDPAELARVVDDALASACADRRFPRPQLVMEPGRAISARAGVTVYRALTRKTEPGARTFVAVDGGMSDNPRVELYGARYTATLANRRSDAPTQPMTIAGRHCESGDEIVRDVALPSDIRSGDLVAVACTGAYHHSMASTYNMVGRPPLVSVYLGQPTKLVRRETVTDLLRRDCEWAATPSGVSCQRADYAALLDGE